MINLYQNEVEAITETVEKVSKKFWGKDATGENLSQLHRELVGRLEDIGFVAEVDVTPVFQGYPVGVSILDRVDGHQDWDVEKRQYELQQQAERNEKTQDIEGNI